ncbi:ABC transporter substrate-binding protein [Agromyces marinus]|uniref:Extracellular solute-binding protein n=1 Tax=Agromyces marinus TaxID=1389020 RepID=A0ABN6YEE2_9MICO|nr:extracellular solute-binding protein [Agromyces marinus]UIP59222.1 hypothetical protein DSM26151_21230 [Agromyces marinus]BDZ55774.1 hypothetical protein GCM10025870_28470 [Agromyces marinus]
MKIGSPPRRGTLGVLGFAAAAVLLAGCASDPEPAPAADVEASDLEGSVSIAMVSATPEYEPFMESQIQAFNELYPNVDVELQIFPPAQYANAINLSFTSGDAPDVYRLTGPSPATNMINSFRNDWLQPLTPFITDEFEDRGFPEGTFDNKELSGLYVGDDIYGLPLESLPYTQVRILYTNMDLLESVGVSEPPETWDDMIDVATKISEQGDGAYGFAMPGQNAVVTVDALAATYGPPMSGGAPINLTDGTSGAGNESYVQTVEMLRDANADGVFTPGWESWDARRPIQEFALGTLGMYVGANFHAKQIRELNPGLNFEMAAIPVPDSGRGGYSPVGGLNQPYWGMSKTAESPEAAWALLDYMSTVQFQSAAYEALGLIPVLDAAYEDNVTEDTARILEIMEETQRVSPQVIMNGPDADQLLSAATASAPSPNVMELYTKVITEGGDYAGPAAAFDEKFNAVIDQTVTKLQADGLDVERSDLVFPKWDPLEDYEG